MPYIGHNVPLHVFEKKTGPMMTSKKKLLPFALYTSYWLLIPGIYDKLELKVCRSEKISRCCTVCETLVKGLVKFTTYIPPHHCPLHPYLWCVGQQQTPSTPAYPGSV